MVFAMAGQPRDFVYRPVNRLDKGTSGLMIVARTPHSQHRLQTMLHSSDFRRVYLAVVEGHLPVKEGVINAPIGKEDAASIRRLVTADGKPSVTRYQVLQEGGSRSLVRLNWKRGAPIKYVCTWRTWAAPLPVISYMAASCRNCRAGSRCIRMNCF